MKSHLFLLLSVAEAVNINTISSGPNDIWPFEGGAAEEMIAAKPDPSAWKEYRDARGEHDCAINEMNNWYGSQRCVQGFECQGARDCTRGVQDLGWCTGDSACPNMGPLDYHDKDGNIKWNLGQQGTWDQNTTSEEEINSYPKAAADKGWKYD